MNAQFLADYIACALGTSHDDDDDDGRVYSADDLAPETLQAMRDECAAFISQAGADLREYRERTGCSGGYDFWLTRNGHGVGFWDRELDELGDRLTAIAEQMGGRDLYAGDDGLIRG